MATPKPGKSVLGNWHGPTKYEDLSAIVDRAESCHAKAHFTASGGIDVEDFTRCIALTRAVHFAGPYTLIYDGSDRDEWQRLAQERDILVSAGLFPGSGNGIREKEGACEPLAGLILPTLFEIGAR